MRALKSELAEYKVKVQDLEQQVEELTTDNEGMVRERSSLKAQIQDMQDRQNSSVESAMRDADSRLAQLDSQLAAAARNANADAELRATLADLKAEQEVTRRLQDQLTSAQTQLTQDRERMGEEISNLRTEKEMLARNLEAVLKNQEDTSAALSATWAGNRQMDAAKQSDKARADMFEKQLEKQQQRITDLTMALAKAQQSSSGYKRDTSSAKEQAVQAERQVKTLTIQLEELQNEKDQVLAAQQYYATKFKTLKEENTELRSKIRRYEGR